MKPDTLSILSLLDAAYRLDVADDVWLGDVVVAGRNVFDRGLGLSGYYVDASRSTEFLAWGLRTTGQDEAVERERFVRWSESAPLELKRVAHLCGAARFASQLPRGDVEPEAVDRSFEVTGWPDVLGICALDATGMGCALAVPCLERAAAPLEQETALWERLAAHIAAAARLRRRGPAPPAAVLSPTGRIEHAQGEARSPAALNELREAARRYDRIRSRRGPSDPLEATRMWRALIAGRWSVVDHFDRDGRRYIVAEENTPEVDPWSRLSPLEARVLRAAGLGHSNKMVAYELGIATSTVSACLRRAATKLGARNRVDLIRASSARFASARPEPQAPDES